MSENVPGHAAPMQWLVVENPNNKPGMSQEEIQQFLDRPIEGMGPLPKSAREATDGEG